MKSLQYKGAETNKIQFCGNDSKMKIASFNFLCTNYFKLEKKKFKKKKISSIEQIFVQTD